MCLISLETSTRRIDVGDVAVIGMVHNFHGSEVKAAVPMIKRMGIVCLCIKEGDELTLGKLPVRFIQAHHLVSQTARVTFRAGVRNPDHYRPDRVEFDNGEVVNFNSLPLKVELTCTARGDQPKPRPVAREEPVHQIVQGGEMVGTGLGASASFLVASVRSDPRLCAGVGALAVALTVVGYALW